jgi:predicted nucleotidyltransferase
MANLMISIPRELIFEFCQRNHIRRLALFGSVLRGDFGPDSDVDVLVDFESGHRVGFAFIALQDELSSILGRQVDLNTQADLSRYFRDEVARTALQIYPAGAERAA